MGVSSPPSIRFSELGHRAQPPTIARLMTMALENPNLLSLAAGFTDNHTLPVDFVTEAVASLANKGGEPEHLQYGSNQGRTGLRRVLAERLHAAEPSLSPANELAEQIVVTNGSQQVLYLAMQVLCDPGDIVLVDRPSYFVFLEMLAGLGIRAISMPVDSKGELDREGLSHLLDDLHSTGEADRLKAVYFVSYFSNPSGRSLNKTEKNLIAEVLTEKALIVPVLEDAAYRELYYSEAEPAPSVLSLPAWSAFPKLYSSTLTKPFATGLKIGFGLCTDPTWLNKILYAKGHHDFGSNHFNQAICETVLRNGAFDRQLKIVRSTYREKCDALHSALEKGKLRELGWKWSRPKGGLYLWVQAPEKIDTGLEGEFCRACVKEGVLYVPGDLCFGENPVKNFARLSFGVLSIEKLAIAAARFSTVAHQFH